MYSILVQASPPVAMSAASHPCSDTSVLAPRAVVCCGEAMCTSTRWSGVFSGGCGVSIVCICPIATGVSQSATGYCPALCRREDTKHTLTLCSVWDTSHRRRPLPLLLRVLFLALSITIALLPISSLGAIVVAARVVPPVPSGPFACDGATHATRVHHAIPSFSVGGPSCLTISANRCTYQKGLNITIPSSVPPSGMNPLVRILIYGSTFLSTNTEDPALLIQSTSSATSQHYRFEVVIANSTIRAERTSGSGTVNALQFSSIHFINAIFTVFGCHIAAINNATGDGMRGLHLESAPLTSSTFQLLSSTCTVESSGSRGSAHAVDFSNSPPTDTHLNISGSLLNATTVGNNAQSLGISFSASPLLRSTVRLFSSHVIGHTMGDNSAASCLHFSLNAITQSMVGVYGGTLSASSARNDALAVYLKATSHLSNSVVSFHDAAISAFSSSQRSDTAFFFIFSSANIAASTVEAIGGSISVTSRLKDGIVATIQFTSFTAGSTIRTNGTAITCENDARMCIGYFISMSSVTDSLFGFYGGSLRLRGGIDSMMWYVTGSRSNFAGASLVFSRCDAQLSHDWSAILFRTEDAYVNAGTTLFWHYSTYSLNGGYKQQPSPNYRCDGGAICPDLSVRIDDASTPLMPSTCPHCLAPYGAAVPFDDGSGSDYSIRSFGCPPWTATLTFPLTATYSGLHTTSSTIAKTKSASGTQAYQTASPSDYFTNTFTFAASETCSVWDTPTATDASPTNSNSPMTSASASTEDSQRNSKSDSSTESLVATKTTVNEMGTKEETRTKTARTKTKSRSGGRRRPPRGKGVPFEDYPFVFKSNERRNP